MIPLRLIFGEQSQHVVHVDATDINIVTERTVAAFPVPLGSYRVAIDTNIPQVVVSIQGIIQDDPIGGISGPSPSAVSWRIDPLYPTTVPATSNNYSIVQTILTTSSLILQPAFWKFNSPNCFNNRIVLKFNSSVSNRAGGATTPSVSGAATLAENVNDVVINVPIGGVLYSPANDNPASTLALIIQDALQLTTEITKTSSVDGVGGKRVVDAFDVSVDGSTIHIRDTYIIDRINHTPLFRLNNSANQSLATGVTTLASQGGGSTKGLSAGDKAQNLLGLLSNSKRDDDLLRGIQIPYNSLITSNDISPVVRNFFLTSGKVSPLQKGSLRNTRPSTQPMEIGKVDFEGEEGGFVTRAFENIGDFSLDLLPIGGVGDVIGDAWSKLTGAGTLNNGGISVIPESFHMSKEGANNYYQFDLQVISADHVIGVV